MTVVVIGAGILGCAVAYELSKKSDSVFVLEMGPRIAEGVTSRNSGVIHAGIYYPPNSLRAQSCVRGNALLYEWCAKHNVSHKKTGKWIVCTKDEEEKLLKLFENAKESGAKNLSLVDKKELEAAGLKSDLGIFSPETGIVDQYEFSNSYRVEAEKNGADFVMNTKVTAIENLNGKFKIETSNGPIECDKVVNCAGLYSDEIAKMVGVDKYKYYPCRGDYFRFNTNQKFDRLIYPLVDRSLAGLGVHLTIALDGSYRFGPDTEYLDSKEDFSDPKNIEEKKKKFVEAASKYMNGVTADSLLYDSCGIRPKLKAPEEPVGRDFILSEDIPGFVNLIGIESPGLTASPDLAERAAKLINS